MKKLLIILAIIPFGIANSQNNDSVILAKMNMADQYMKGYGKPLNPAKALDLYKECANSGNAKAMNAVGMQYRMGKGTTVNYAEAMKWFTQSGQKGYAAAWYNLGMMYKYGYGVGVDYTKAYEYFVNAATLNNTSGWYAQGYMLYKGLGCNQDYEKAYNLFSKGAKKGKVGCMYFLGLCLRNGYGTTINTDSASYWLKKASNMGYTMADDELAASDPENAEIAGNLTEKIKAAQKAMPLGNAVNQYHKVEHQIPAGSIIGIYNGFLLKYDWSGKKVVEVSSLKVELKVENDSLKGTWTEADSLIVPIKAHLTPKAMVFEKMQYSKSSHYDLSPDLLVFNNANLQLTKTTDGTVYLSGNLQQYSPRRKEPSKPLYVALTRTVASVSNQNIDILNEDGSTISSKGLIAYPNPFGSTITLNFELKEQCKVTTQLVTLDGKVVYTNSAGILTAGYYTLPIQTQEVASGYYTLVLHCGNKIRSTKVVKL